jgi:2',3'-cyclic-nucleotide 2'-phosphodiesterase (5'-nucleotidase family)
MCVLFSSGSLFSVETAPEPAPANVRLQIFHTNDIHGWILSRPAVSHKADPKRLVGGAAVLANAIKLHSEPGSPRMLFDSGDWFQGTPEGAFSKGRAVTSAFNALGYDAVALGNHEFDYGLETLKGLISDIKVPVVCSNLIEQSTGKRASFARPYLILEVSGVKVGVFGLLTSNMKGLVFPENFAGFSAGGEVEWARKTVSEMKAGGADIVILLSHVGIVEAELGKPRPPGAPVDDAAIASQVPGIDLIIGGHTHTVLREPWRDPVNGTLVVQAGSNLARVGKVVLEIDPKARKVVASRGGLIDLWVDETGEDGGVLKLAEKFKVAGFDEEIGRSAVSLTRNPRGESSAGDWITDCERKYAKTQVALHNSGGIRTDIGEGPISRRTIYQTMPFNNSIVTLTMTGAQLLGVLENSVSGGHGILQVSGLEMAFDPRAAAGGRVREVRVGGKPISESEVYTVSVNDFLFKGGEGYSFSAASDEVILPVLLREMLEWCVRKRSPVQAPEAGRIRKL